MLRLLRLLRIRSLALAVALVAATTGCAAPSAPPTTIELVVPAGGLGETIEQPVKLGSEVTLRVTTEEDDRIHVHGYEIEFDTPGGVPVERVFTANMAGAYEIESHGAGQIYMKLIVR